MCVYTDNFLYINTYKSAYIVNRQNQFVVQKNVEKTQRKVI